MITYFDLFVLAFSTRIMYNSENISCSSHGACEFQPLGSKGMIMSNTTSGKV